MLSKPIRGLQIDRTHPWVDVAGMQGFYACNENSGNIIADGLRRNNLTISPSNLWTGTGSQIGLKFTSTGNGSTNVGIGYLPTSMQYGWPISIACSFRLLGNCVSTPAIFSISYNSSDTSPWCVINLYGDTGSGDYYLGWNSAGIYTAIGGTAWVVGAEVVLSATITATTQILYINGVAVNTHVAAASNPNYTATSAINLGNTQGNSNTNTNTLFYWGAWWNKALPAAVHSEIGRNVNSIWQIYPPYIPTTTHILFDQGISRFAISPTIANKNLEVPVTATGIGTNWTTSGDTYITLPTMLPVTHGSMGSTQTAATTFAVTGGSGASLTGTSLNVATQTAAFTLNTGTVPATLIIKDSTDSNTANFTTAYTAGTQLQHWYTKPPRGTLPDLTHPLLGAAGWWPLNDGNGNAQDATLNHSTGIPNGTTWTSGVYGRTNYCLNTNGSTAYMDFGANQALNIVGPITIAVWIYPTQGSNWQSIVSNSNGTTYGYELVLSPVGTGYSGIVGAYIQTFNGSGGYGTSANPGFAYPTTKWHHIVGVYDGATLYTYVDGALISTAAVGAGALASSTQHCVIGRRASGTAGVYYGGFVDQLGVWPRALGAGEIQQLYQNSWQVYPMLVPSGYILNQGTLKTTISPVTANCNSATAVTATGIGTTWTTGTTFSVTGGSGASISGLSVNVGAQTATFTLNTGIIPGLLLIGNNTDATIADFTATIATIISPTFSTQNAAVLVTATGLGTTWTTGTTFSVTGGSGASISGLSVNAVTQVATFTLNPGTKAATLTIGDSTDAITNQFTVIYASITAILRRYSKPPRGTLPSYTHKLLQMVGGFWPFNDGNNITAYDSSLNHNNGTLVGGASWVPGLAGRTGYTLQLDGSTGYVNCGSNKTIAITGSGPITLAAWIMPTNVPVGGQFPRVISTNNGTNGYDLILGCYNTGYWSPYILLTSNGFQSYFRNANTNVSIASPATVWTHVAITYNGNINVNNAVTYFNGIQTDIGTLGANAMGTIPGGAVTIGATPGSGYNFQGRIDQAGIWNRMLSASEILDLYENSWQVYPVLSQISFISNQGSIKFSISPTTALGNSAVTVTATGIGTSWTNGTTFTVTGGTGSSISGLSVNTSTQVATFTLNTGTAAGRLTIGDSVDTVKVWFTVALSFSLSVTTGNLNSAIAITATGTGTAWTTGTTFSVTGTGSSITGLSVNASTQVATFTLYTGTVGSVLAISDSTDAAVTQFTVPISFTLSPALGSYNTIMPTITATGINTTWTTGTLFYVSGIVGATLSGLSVNASTQTATFTLYTGTTTGTLTIGDSTDTASAQLVVNTYSAMASGTGGNLTSAATWSLVDVNSYGPCSFATYYATAVTTSYVSSSTFITGPITIDGIAILIANIGGTATGTLTVSLISGGSTVSGTTASINTSTLPYSGWVFFKLSTPVALSYGAYAVQIQKSATADTVTVNCTNSTSANWCRALRMPVPGLPAVTGSIIICGERTGLTTYNTINVVMNNTATSLFCADFNLCDQGQLTMATVTANYYLKISSWFVLWGGTTFNVGTVGTPFPTASTMTFELAGSTNFVVGSYATLSMYGATKTSWTSLTSTAASGQAVLNVATNTGWAAGDSLVIATTDQTNANTELQTIQSQSAQAVTLSSNLTNTHLGVSPYVGEVANLTRNIVLKTTSGQANFDAQNSANVTLYYVQFAPGWGGTAATEGNCGFFFANTNASYTQVMRYCSINFGGTSSYNQVFIANAAVQNITIDNNVFYNMNNSTANTIIGGNITQLTYTNNLIISEAANCPGYSLLGSGITFTGNHIVGTAGAVSLFGISGVGNSLSTITNNVVHSSTNNNGLWLNNSGSATINNLIVWKVNCGIGINNNELYTFNNCSVYGCTGSGTGYAIFFSSISGSPTTDFEFNNCTFYGCNYLMQCNAGSLFKVYFNNCTIGSPTQMVTAEVGLTATFWTIVFDNCTLSPTTPRYDSTSRATNSVGGAIIVNSPNYQAYLAYNGTISADTTTYHNNSPSLQIAPINALVPQTAEVAYIPVNAGDTVTVGCWIYQSSSFIGTPPYISIEADPCIGVTGVIGSATTTLATWQYVSISTTATGQGIVRILVGCAGTAGYADFDSFTATTPSYNTTGFNYWSQGSPMLIYGK